MSLKNDAELARLLEKDKDRQNPSFNENEPRSKSTSQKSKHASHFVEYLDPSPRPDKYSPKAPFFQWLTFADIFPYVKRINKASTKFESSDIPNPEHTYNIESKIIDLDRQWAKELKKPNPKFFTALSKAFFPEIAQATILMFIDNTTKVYYSIYMGKIVDLITTKELGDQSKSDELVFAGILLTVLVVISLFCKNWSLFATQANIGRAKLAISGFLYKKLNSTSLTSLHEIKLGKVINLLGNDLNDMQTLLMVPQLIVNPYMIALGTYMMWRYFGFASLIGLAAVIVILFLQIHFTNLTESPRKENKKITDERVKLTHEIIEGIRLIKMYTWEKFFKSKIVQLRQEEENTFMRILHYDAIGRNISSLSVYINIFVICSAYVLFGGILTPEKVYASMMILLYISHSLQASQQGRMGLVNFRLITKRIEEVLAIKDVLFLENATINPRIPSGGFMTKQEKSVVFKDFTGYWTKSSQKPCLSNINITFNPGVITSVIGRIGSGKTSLLLSFLRELPLTSGTLDFSGKIAYVEQDPVIFSGTFQENILFGRELDEVRYNKILKDCKLVQDLEHLPHGDLTLIGERGVNLSGGQKTRISLARALYSDNDIYLLDDPFSALDSRIARDIFDNVLVKGLAAKEKIVILVTHHLQFAKESDFVVLMNEGKIEAQGKFEDLEKLNLSVLNIFKVEAEKKMNQDQTKVSSIEEKPKNTVNVTQKTQERGPREEAVQVSKKTYKDYMKIVGTTKTFLILGTLFILPHTIIVYYSKFIGYWAEEQTRFYYDKGSSNTEAFDNRFYIAVSIVMLCVILLISYIKTMKLYSFLISTNTELHQRMLSSLLRAKTLFFDTNPVGRILNRFANDLGVLDKTNPRYIYEFLDNAISHISLLVTVCLINPIIIIPTLIVLYGLYLARMFFDKPMIHTKKIELASKSPMLSAIPATLQGLVIIRVYNQGGRFVRSFMDLIYNNMKAFIFLTKASRLFAFVLETPVQLLNVAGVWIFIGVILCYKFDASLLGLSLMYLLKLGSHSSLVVRQSLEIDVYMQSAQRMLDYCEIKSEAPEQIPEKDTQIEKAFEGNWPNRGEIVFNKVYMKYREDLGFALNGLTLKIPGGLKVACVGRTGAGKTSIVQTLFRMVEIEEGSNYPDSYIKIDDVNIRHIGLNLLRSCLSIIPQVPVIFTSTIKRNLDPFDRLNEKDLWNVLEEVGLKDYVDSLENKLETDMTVSNTVFSAGQKQLICLARAIINRSKIIIFDEATANVDMETEAMIQKTIMQKFKDCTVITIAHRLITIANYDKVVVVDKGQVVEYDSPYALLIQQEGDSQITKKNGLFATLVKSTGESMSRTIFDMARSHFYENKKNND